MTFPRDPKSFSLYNYGTSTAVITTIVFATSQGTQHRADLSGFGGSTTFSDSTLTGLSVNLAPLSFIPFTLDYTNADNNLLEYPGGLTISATINGRPDAAALDNTIVVSTTPVADTYGGGGGDGGGASPGTCADSTSCSADGGGGGGGGKVICTALYELGLMDKDIYEYDQAFGLWLYQNNPVAYKGYRMWADILVAYVKGQGRPLLPKLMFWKTREEQQDMSQRIAVAVAQFVGSAFANEIARRAGHDLPWTLRGWLVVSLGLRVCKGIGYVFAKTKKYKELTQ
jgi:hypothetical protein